MKPAELLQRIAKTLRDDVGPAVDGEYPKTQAFMAAVVLQKLGRELALAEAHRAADATDLRGLADELIRWRGTNSQRGRAAIDASTMTHDVAGASAGDQPADSTAVVPPNLAAAIDRFAVAPAADALCDVVESLYAARDEIGTARFDAMLGRVRATLRKQIDRRVEFAK
jgi:hypothetical protein